MSTYPNEHLGKLPNVFTNLREMYIKRMHAFFKKIITENHFLNKQLSFTDKQLIE